jgi:hypothetical protein
MNYYIGTRHNPQFKEPYYVAYGKLTKKQAKEYESCLYGSMYLESYESEEKYRNAVCDLESQGKRVSKR